MNSLVRVNRAMREDRGRFAALQNARVLIYWPHGLGDWVHLSAITPFLEETNTYAITRFGDDYVSVMEGNPYLLPLFSGVQSLGDGSGLGTRHLGLRLRRLNGGGANVQLPPALSRGVQSFAPDALLWTDYPETEGHTAYPFHTKARNLARLLVRAERLALFDLSRRLKSTIHFNVLPAIQKIVDDRLAQFAPAGTRLCILSRTGFSAERKNWGTTKDAAELVAGLRRDDPHRRIVSMDGEVLGDGSVSFRALFEDLDQPFARIYKALLARAELFIGVPAGPLHMAMAFEHVPVIGIWLAHHPDWYDEPNSNAIHVIGRHVRDRGFDRRAASVTKPDDLKHRIVQVESLNVSAAHILDCVDVVEG
jgi:hypothetical protein